MSDPEPEHTERLWAPPAWWAVGALGVAAVWLVLVVSTSALVTTAGTVAATILVVAGLGAVGAVEVGIREAEFVAGRAHVPLAVCGRIEPLDAAATRRLRGTDADARAFLVLRPWLSRGVRVELRDPADPTPYWLVSARHPERIVAAADGVRSVQGSDPP